MSIHIYIYIIIEKERAALGVGGETSVVVVAELSMKNDQ